MNECPSPQGREGGDYAEPAEEDGQAAMQAQGQFRLTLQGALELKEPFSYPKLGHDGWAFGIWTSSSHPVWKGV